MIVVAAMLLVAGILVAGGRLDLVPPSGGSGSPPAAFASVKFVESGLVRGTPWSVTLDGLTATATTPSIVYSSIFNGNYSYYANATGYALLTGYVTVHGAAVTVPLTFTPQTTYPVEFNETGLPSGSSWSVTVNGVTFTSSTSVVSFSEPNGSYHFSVVAEYYACQPSSGDFRIQGGGFHQTITCKFIY